MITNNIFSWQAKEWEQIYHLRQQSRLPHALLFSGINGIGKKQFSLALAQALLCLNDNKFACQYCSECLLFQAQSHPDLLIIEPDETGGIIKIDSIRQMIPFVNQTALRSGYRIIIICPANAMNHNAANALLKSLEEPPLNCIFILVTDASLALLPTIKSRCQEIKFSKPQEGLAQEWLMQHAKIKKEDAILLLHLTSGSPLKAMQWITNDLLSLRNQFYTGLDKLMHDKTMLFSFSAEWVEKDLLFLCELLQTWALDLLRMKLIPSNKTFINSDFYDSYLKIVNKVSIKDLLEYSDSIRKLYTVLSNKVHLNKQLVLDEIMIKWVKYVSG